MTVLLLFFGFGPLQSKHQETSSKTQSHLNQFPQSILTSIVADPEALVVFV
jgi:hypothetical protein